MGARSDFAQLQGMRSFAGRATALYGWSRNLLGDGIPAVTRITLSLPLGILLSTRYRQTSHPRTIVFEVKPMESPIGHMQEEENENNTTEIQEKSGMMGLAIDDWRTTELAYAALHFPFLHHLDV